MPDTLATVRARAAARKRAAADLLEAVKEAREAGYTLEAIAQAAGLTRQRVYQLLGPTGRRTKR